MTGNYQKEITIGPDEAVGCILAGFYALIFFTALTGLLGAETPFHSLIEGSIIGNAFWTVFGFMSMVMFIGFTREKLGILSPALPTIRIRWE